MESMTGFGKGFVQLENYQIYCLVKSVNHRFLEITLKLPKRYSLLEERIRKRVGELFSRGKIEIYFKIYGFSPQKKEIYFDLELAKGLKDNLLKMKEFLELSGDVSLSDIIQFKEIILIEEKEEDLEVLWEEIKPALEIALLDLKDARLKEGNLLKEKIREYLQTIERGWEEISLLKDQIRELNIRKMKERVASLLKEFHSPLDEVRLYQEIAFLLDKMDFSEELDRIKIHLTSAKALLEASSSGKKLDFLCQELMREINTLSNKAQSAEISLKAVEIKDFIEKIREQVQNIV
ncbi:MAG: YicC/YloC family endoribonuclease [Caldimicrobium sp.]